LNIALFAPYLPAPAHSGGRIRIQQFAKALTRIGEVSLFACADSRDIAQHGVAPELDLFSSTHIARSASAWLTLPARPARVRRCCPRALTQKFLDVHARHRFSVVVVEHSHAATVALEYADVPWLLDEHNIESRYFQAKVQASRRSLLSFDRAEVRALERWEQHAWRSASEVVCVSEADAAAVEGASGRTPLLIPNGVELGRVPFLPPSQRQGFELLFVGVLGHPPNAAAARWLAREVLPRVQRVEPRATLLLCGADPTPEVAKLANASVSVTGRVPSVAPYLQRAALYVNALQQGAGSSLKVLEALASGLPLVSTASGVRGFPLADGEHYLRAETADDFARATLACFAERANADGMARRAREFAEAHDFEHLARQFATAVRDLSGSTARSFRASGARGSAA
jgi:glycosyltransferase involved in cell wall biosynthesis